MNVSELLKYISTKLAEHDIDSFKAEAELIISHFLNLAKMDIYLNSTEEVFPDLADKILALVDKRCQHYPLQYLLGSVHFYNTIIKVNPHVLIPRPETELLVESILSQNPSQNLKVLDLCTGSGAIAIALKKAKPSWQVYASDISEEALVTAQDNAKLNNCPIKFILSDLFFAINDKFDLIVSNPPYISQIEYDTLKPELMFEPVNALKAEDNGMFFYDKILSQAQDYLYPQAKLYLELSAPLSAKIKEKAEYLGYSNIVIKSDLNQYPRILSAQKN